MFELSAGLLFT